MTTSESAQGEHCCGCGASLSPTDQRCPACGFDWNVADVQPEPVRSRFGPGHCDKCGYDVQNLPSERCPECGHFYGPVKDPLPERIAEWRMIETGARRLGICSATTAALSLTTLTASLASDWGAVPAHVIGMQLVLPAHAVTTLVGYLLLRKRRSLKGDAGSRPARPMPRSGAALAALVGGWVIWATLLAIWWDFVLEYA